MCILAIAIFYESENVVFLLPFKKFNFLSCVGRGLQGISSKKKYIIEKSECVRPLTKILWNFAQSRWLFYISRIDGNKGWVWDKKANTFFGT